MSKSKKNQFFKYDADTTGKANVIRLRMKHGWAGFGIYMAIKEQLFKNDNVLSNTPDMLAFSVGADVDTITSIINDFGLFEFEGSNFYCPEIQEAINYMTKCKEAGKRGAAKREANKKSKEDNFMGYPIAQDFKPEF